MTSTRSRSKPVPIPITIPSKDVSSSSDEDNANFVGTPYRFDRSNPYEYPFPTSTSTPQAALPSNGTRPTPSSAALPLSNTVPTLSFLFSRSSLVNSSCSACSNTAIPPTKPPLNQPPPSPRRHLHSRLPSLIAIGLKLDVPAPIPPNLIGKNLGTLSPALGLEPGEVLTSEKASMSGWRERVDGPTAHPDPVAKKAGP